MDNHLGLSHFLRHIDHVGISVAILLLSLSIASWYLIITKRIRINNVIQFRATNLFTFYRLFFTSYFSTRMFYSFYPTAQPEKLHIH